MPFFYFDLYEDGRITPDQDGIRMAQLEDAKLEAAVSLAIMLGDAIKAGPRPRNMEIVIRGKNNKQLARISVVMKVEGSH